MIYQFSSVAQSCLKLCDPMNCSTPGLLVHHQILEITQTHVHQVGDAIQPSYALSSPSPPTPNSFQLQSIFQWVNSLHEVQSKGLSRVFSNTTVQKHLPCSVFFIAQLSHPYMTTGKNIVLTRRIFAGKVMSLLFNMPPSLVIAFLPSGMRLLTSWLQSPSAVILEPRKIVCH